MNLWLIVIEFICRFFPLQSFGREAKTSSKYEINLKAGKIHLNVSHEKEIEYLTLVEVE